ncbi:MAG TPA: hypothetical protein VFS55_12055, partial [Dokdonella sp.]|nr:hypothetical protein [Dokdonella sp.]
MKLATLALMSVFAASAAAHADDAVFDTHVHLHGGEASLRAYEADVAAAHIKLAGFAGMWFGGPNQALAGDPAAIRKADDAHIALA